MDFKAVSRDLAMLGVKTDAHEAWLPGRLVMLLVLTFVFVIVEVAGVRTETQGDAFFRPLCGCFSRGLPVVHGVLTDIRPGLLAGF